MPDLLHMESPKNFFRSGSYPETYDLKSVILDLEGAVVQTKDLHRLSWKEVFKKYQEENQSDQFTFSDEDFVAYFAGKQGTEGLQSFLASKGIDLPFGNNDNAVSYSTISGLCNLKSRLFLDLLESNDVKTYDNSIVQIRAWKSMGLKCGLVTSSESGGLLLEKAGLVGLFDSKIDLSRISERHLRDKPAPDIYLESARDLGTTPSECVVFDDSVYGVQAGTRANISLVVGIAHSGNKKSLFNNGADVVVDNLSQIDLNSKEIKMFFTEYAPSLFSNYQNFMEILGDKKPVLFLDYDGTLTPIVKNPSDAILSDEMRSVLSDYGSKFPVAIISGRDMDDLKNLVKIKDMVYGGSHGFRISGPDGLYMEHSKSADIIPGLNAIEKKLHVLFDGKIKGIKIERKRYAIAVHYRNVGAEFVPGIIEKVVGIIGQNPGFRKGEGKKVIEVRPDVDWHKGKAISWLLERPEFLAGQEVVPIYIGDDLTDEDVFATLPEQGIGILVGFHGGNTKARYSLKNVYQVQNFIEMLTNHNQK
jgi:trehalose 6-phosphate phosphatase